MKMPLEKSTGAALIAGSLLMVVTMVLHPAGGSIQHLLKTAGIIIISHSIALLAIPFLAVGFWGLTKKIGMDSFFSVTAFAMILFGLTAGMIAASVNGLALPLFIQDFKESSPDIAQSLKQFLNYNIAINHAFDYVFIGSICLSVLFWSIAILVTKAIPLWTGYAGIFLFIVVTVMLFSGISFVNLNGFRLYMAAIVAWIVSAGLILTRSEAERDKSTF